MAYQKREYQQKNLLELRTLQKNIKTNKAISETEKRKFEKDIALLESENSLLDKKQQETQELLKKFYQQSYIMDMKQDKTITLMGLLSPKSF